MEIFITVGSIGNSLSTQFSARTFFVMVNIEYTSDDAADGCVLNELPKDVFDLLYLSRLFRSSPPISSIILLISVNGWRSFLSLGDSDNGGKAHGEERNDSSSITIFLSHTYPSRS